MMRPSTPLTNLQRYASIQVDEGRGAHGVVLQGLGEIALPDTLVSPGAVIAAINELKQYGTNLNNDITSHASSFTDTAVGQRFKNDWNVWVARFDAWNRSTGSARGALSYAFGGVVSDLRRYASEYNALEARYRSITGEDPTYQPEPQNGQILPTEAWIAIGLGVGVVSLVAIAWTASSVAKVTRPLRGRRR